MQPLDRAELGPIHQVTGAPYNLEPYIAVDPANSSHLATIAIRASRFDCRPRPRGACEINLYLHESYDGGETWNEARLTDAMGFDGQVIVGTDGTLYAVGMENAAVFLQVGFPDHGLTPVMRHLIDSGGSNDKPWLTIDPRTGAFYVAYTLDKDLVVRRSLDGGMTWGDPVTVVEGPELFRDGEQVETPPWGGQVLIGPQHELAVTWLHSEQMRGATCLEWQAWIATSSDGGMTFSAPRQIAQTRGIFTPICHDGMYAVFYRAETAAGQELHVAISEDGARTWSRHVVSGGMQLHAALVPAPGVGVAPNGTLDVVFYDPAPSDCYDLDGRNRVYLDHAANAWVDGCHYHVYYCYSTDHGRHWSVPRQINAAPIEGTAFVRIQGLSRPGEYIGMASTDEAAFPVWIEGTHVYTRRITRSLLLGAARLPCAVRRGGTSITVRPFPRLLLVCGMPATGKTTFGDWLRDTHGYVHLDLESRDCLAASGLPQFWPNRIWDLDPAGLDRFFAHLRSLARGTVLTWAFHTDLIPLVRDLVQRGCAPWWFEGDRLACRAAHRRRKRIIRQGVAQPGEPDMQHYDAYVASLVAHWAAIGPIFGDNIIRSPRPDETYLQPDAIFDVIQAPG